MEQSPVRKPYPIWDCHVHMFPENLMKAIFKFFRERYRWNLPFPTAIPALLQQLRGQGVSRAFVLAYVHKPGLARQVNRWLAELSAENPWLVPFGAIHPADMDLAAVLDEALDLHRFAGLKLHCLVQQLRPDDEKLYPVYEALAERSKGLFIHASSFPLPAEERLSVRYIANLLSKFPGLNMVVPHLGLYDMAAYRALLQEYPNLYLDTAFVFQNQSFVPPTEEIAALLTDFPERILYGSDFPFILEPPQNGITRILQLDLPQPLYYNLFYANARRFLCKINPSVPANKKGAPRAP